MYTDTLSVNKILCTDILLVNKAYHILKLNTIYSNEYVGSTCQDICVFFYFIQPKISVILLHYLYQAMWRIMYTIAFSYRAQSLIHQESLLGCMILFFWQNLKYLNFQL